MRIWWILLEILWICDKELVDWKILNEDFMDCAILMFLNGFNTNKLLI